MLRVAVGFLLAFVVFSLSWIAPTVTAVRGKIAEMAASTPIMPLTVEASAEASSGNPVLDAWIKRKVDEVKKFGPKYRHREECELQDANAGKAQRFLSGEGQSLTPEGDKSQCAS